MSHSLSSTPLYFHRVHVVFGHVISGQEVVQTMENQKTDPNSRPYSDVKVMNCGELVPKSKGLFVQSIFCIFKMSLNLQLILLLLSEETHFLDFIKQLWYNTLLLVCSQEG